jgi:hypothetical protein
MVDTRRRQLYGTHFLSALSSLRRNPIVNVLESVETQCYFFGGALWELKSDGNELTHSPGVRLATVRDLYLTEGNIDRSERDYARKQRCPAVILAEAGKLAHETASAPLYADNGIV